MTPVSSGYPGAPTVIASPSEVSIFAEGPNNSTQKITLSRPLALDLLESLAAAMGYRVARSAFGPDGRPLVPQGAKRNPPPPAKRRKA